MIGLAVAAFRLTESSPLATTDADIRWLEPRIERVVERLRDAPDAAAAL